MNKIVLVLILLISTIGYSQYDSTEWFMPDKKVVNIQLKAAPMNDDCSSASILVIDAGLNCTGTTFDATLQVGECYTNYGGGSTEHSVWYSFTANNDSLVFAFNKINYTNCVSPHIRIYDANLGCLPVCGTEIYNYLHNGDPGQNTMLTSLTIGATYLVQVVDLYCGGPNDRHTEFCIGVFSPLVNNISSGSAGIDSCGQTYNGTNTGYTPEDLISGGENLDGNIGTTCPTCTPGDDVPYVVNNSSWFSFCTTLAGVYNIDFSGITNCVNPSPNYGLQMTIFSGTANNLTFIESAPSPSNPGSSWSSSNFNVAAGECIFLVVDGFAGDQCDYQYILNNISGGCNLAPLPIDLVFFNGELIIGTSGRQGLLKWVTATEINNDYYNIERSIDGYNWETIHTLSGAGNSIMTKSYKYIDVSIKRGVNYYKLTQFDFNGLSKTFDIITINNEIKERKLIKVLNFMGQEVNEYSEGLLLYHYSNGEVIKMVSQ
jgi:hypothetical protein